MKYLNYIAALLLTTTMFAQKNPSRKPTFTVEQRAELLVKKLDLALDLDENQITEITPIFIAKIKKTTSKIATLKKDKKKLSNDDMFEIAKTKLADEATLQIYLKKILTRDQFKMWQQSELKLVQQSI